MIALARAHPRSRGENVAVSVPTGGREGSSPLTRGKQAGTRNGHGSRGLIPAHAGKTLPPGRVSVRTPAHPRSRGENKYARGGWLPSAGSSPLTRGKHILIPHILGVRGLIPAHAGKTRPLFRQAPTPRAHPRSRGENGEAQVQNRLVEGSSPLTRGKHLSEGGRAGRVGLIPAHAGKTPPPTAWKATTRAHPRSRGENPVQQGALGLAAGSSPLTRGKRRRRRGDR